MRDAVANRLIAVDWGSTSLRAARIGPDGRLAEIRRSDQGALRLGRGEFAACLDALVGDWLPNGDRTPVILSGMVGSRNGWHEVPYIECPASLEELSNNLHRVPDYERNAWIVPGVTGETPAGRADVMRGEEVQLMGTFQAGDDETRVFVLPGTHSKWVLAREKLIQRFATVVSGELFALLGAQGSLSTLLVDEEDAQDSEFLRGVMLSREPGGLLHHVFSLRSACLLGQVSGGQAKHRLSGLIIGHEIREMLPCFRSSFPITVVGAPSLGLKYRTAMAALGHDTVLVDGEQASLRGALALARRAFFQSASDASP